jgi:signal transduction histidine kinase
MNRRLQRVHVASLRVALMASGILAVVYAVVAAIVVVVVTNSLTSQVDDRLSAVLSGQRTATPTDNSTTRGEPYTSTVIAWVVGPNGTSPGYLVGADGGINLRFVTNAVLPVSANGITAPTTLTMNGHDFRLEGADVPGGRVIVGQTLDSVSQTRSTIITTEAIVGLVLLLVAFVGALIGGRRVGAPIELARQKQMEFTADASHELRTPLSVIEAQTSLALAQDRDASWYRSAFQRIANESQRIRRLVEDLLWLARVDSVDTREQAEPVEVGVLAAGAVERFATVAEARKLSLTVNVTAEPHVVSGSPEWLDRLLGVLVDNACKYAPENGRVHVQVDTDGGRVRLVVEDSGPGIPVEERPRIFNRFHRASNVQGGSGLGLAIADAVVRRTHGRWEIGTSARLGGASVAVTWPRAITGGREASRAALAPSPPPVSAPAPPSAAAQPE